MMKRLTLSGLPWLGATRSAAGLNALAALDRRTVRLLLGALLVFVALECWLLLLRAPLAEWRSLVQQRSATAAVSAAALRAEVLLARGALAQAEQTLRDAGLPHADDEMVLQLIALLDRSAQRHGVQLGQVRSGAGVLPQEQIQVATFDGEARGSYLALVDWLAEVEPQIAPLAVTELQLVGAGAGEPLSLRVKFSAFLPVPDPKGATR